MRSMIIFLKNSQGIFNSAMDLKYYNHTDFVYRSIREDKINIKNDMLTFFNDFKMQTNEARQKL